ncbi:MAG: phasin family protein [Sphingomonas sp.]
MTDTVKQAATDAAGLAQDAAGKIKAEAELGVQAGNELRLKLIEQVERNMTEAFAVMRAATQAKDVSELLHLQGEYLRGQTSRAMEQVHELGEIISEYGRDAVGRLTDKG